MNLRTNTFIGRQIVAKKPRERFAKLKAEAVAAVVCQALGLESIEHCADYIQLYNGDSDVLVKSMDHIQKTAAKILEGIDAHTSVAATDPAIVTV